MSSNTNIDGDDDSFSKIGFSDTESVCGKNEVQEEEQGGEERKIEVQLPPHFSVGGSSGNQASPAAHDAAAAASAVASLAASAASSFVPIRSFGKLKVAQDDDGDDNDKKQQPGTKEILVVGHQREKKSTTGGSGNAAATMAASCADAKKSATKEKSLGELVDDAKQALELLKGIPREKKEDDDDDESTTVGCWSVVSSIPATGRGSVGAVATTDADDNSIAASSTISGFDLISLNGSSQKRCQRCSLLNIEDVTICQGCYVALVANPTLTADEKLAQYLQVQEENEAFKDVVYEERKRNSLGHQPLLTRAQALTNDIHSVAESCRLVPFMEYSKRDQRGFGALPHANLTILASRFIDYVDGIAMESDGFKSVQLCFCFTEDQPWRLNQIRQDGFGPHAYFGSNAEAAYQAYQRRGKPSRFWGVLPPIYEGNNQEPESFVPPNTFGWIAAIVHGGRPGQERQDVSIPVRGGGIAWIYSRRDSIESLPLLYFDTKLIHLADTILSLKDGLERTCNDFFGRIADQAAISRAANCDSLASKRQKVEDNSLSEDEAMARAIQASLEDVQDNSDTFLPSSGMAMSDVKCCATSDKEDNATSIADFERRKCEAQERALARINNQATNFASSMGVRRMNNQTMKFVSSRGVGTSSPAYSPTSPAYKTASTANSPTGSPDGFDRAGSCATYSVYSSTSPAYSRQSPASSAMSDVRELSVADALQYLDDVKRAFADQPEICSEFLSIMRNVKSWRVDEPAVIARVTKLFHGHNNLMVGFHKFLPAHINVVDLAAAQKNARLQAQLHQQEHQEAQREHASAANNVEDAQRNPSQRKGDEAGDEAGDDLDGLERVGVIADDSRTRNLQAAAALLEKTETSDPVQRKVSIIQNPQVHQPAAMSGEVGTESLPSSAGVAKPPATGTNHDASMVKNPQADASSVVKKEVLDFETRMIIRKKQHRLLLLHHSARCTLEEGKCGVPHCAYMRWLWVHMQDCGDSHCGIKHCFSSRSILHHYRKCKNPACCPCSPVRAKIKEANAVGKAVSAVTPIDDSLSVHTNMAVCNGKTNRTAEGGRDRSMAMSKTANVATMDPKSGKAVRRHSF